jgi:AcrR family transcriptional regulator
MARPTTTPQPRRAGRAAFGGGGGEAVAQRGLRADARRNREAILKAARKVFSERGQDAQMDDIASRAKVGVGTVYRHFPTKDALLEELVRDSFGELAAMWLEAIERPDPWDAFVDVMWRSAEMHSGDRGFTEAIAEAKMAIADEVVAELGLQASLTELVRRCQAAGSMRRDIEPNDLHSLFCGLGAVMMRSEGDEQVWRRYLTLMLDGLRPPAPAN